MDALDTLRAQFQAELDALHDGETLQLELPRERPGPVVVRKSGVVDGQGLTVWSMTGPVISVAADRVVLRNLRVEFTGETGSGPAEEQCAIDVQGTGVVFENVEVRGSVLGLPEEEGDWRYPGTLYLGRMAYGMEHDCLLRLVVPVPCRLSTDIAGLEVEPRSLSPGAHEVRLHIERLPQDTLLNGSLSLSTAFLKRRMMVSAHILAARDGEPAAPVETNRVVWQPDDWAAHQGGARPAPAPRPSVSVRPRPAPPPTAPIAPPPVAAPPPLPSATPPPLPTSLPQPVAVVSPPRAATAPPTTPPPLPPTPTPATPSPPARSSFGMRRIQGSPLSKLFSPKAEPAEPAEGITPPETLASPVPSIFLGPASQSPPSGEPPAADSPLPDLGSATAGRPSTSKSVRMKPVSTIFGQPPPSESPRPDSTEEPAPDPEGSGGVEKKPAPKRSRSLKLPSIFSPKLPPQEPKKEG